MQSYITHSEISNDFDTQLFQIATLHLYSKRYNKCMCLDKQNAFIQNTGLFENKTIDINSCHIICESDDNQKIVPYGKDIMLNGEFINFKLYDDDILECMRDFIYSNEDYMYTAYKMYNEIKEYFKCGDDNMVSLYLSCDDNIIYYAKSHILMNKKNIVVFTDDTGYDDYWIDGECNVYRIWHDNIYVRFILLSFFKHNIINYTNPYFSLWASYISYYEDVKNISLPSYIMDIVNEKLNNTNIIYLD